MSATASSGYVRTPGPLGTPEWLYVAECLDWYAKNKPGIHLSDDALCQLATGKALSLVDEEERSDFRKIIAKARKALRAYYKRDMFPSAKLGFRASVDATDRLVNGLIPKIRRPNGAIKAAADYAAELNMAEVKDTPEMQPYIQRVKEFLDVVKLVGEKFKELSSPLPSLLPSATASSAP